MNNISNNNYEIQIPSFLIEKQQRQISSQNQTSLERTPQDDEFVSGNKKAGVKQQKNANRTKKLKQICSIRGFLAGLATAATIYGGTQIIKPYFDSVTIPFESSETTLDEIANTFQVDIETLNKVNDIDIETNLSKLDELKIPVHYDYIQNEIESAKKELYSSDPDNKEKINNRIDALNAKKQEQNDVAEIYKDGKFLYIHVKDLSDNPEMQQKYGYDSISAERLKKLFDIEDGALKRYNSGELHCKWRLESDGNSYFDYRNATVPYGHTVIVPENSINTDNINLDEFTE